MQAIPKRPIEVRSEEISDGVAGLIGNTPLLRINSLSDLLGVEILGKAEFLNPGGSVKDRVALKIIEDAEARGLLRPHTGSILFEGTVGSTGISLATVGKAKGYESHIIMPSDVAMDKVQVLERLGATVERVPPVSFVDQNQFVVSMAGMLQLTVESRPPASARVWRCRPANSQQRRRRARINAGEQGRRLWVRHACAP